MVNASETNGQCLRKKELQCLVKDQPANQILSVFVYFYEIIWAKTSFNYRQDYIQH